MYESDIMDYLKVVNSIEDSAKTVAVFGHNETISEFATYLTGKIAEFRTTGIVIISISGSWAEVSGGVAKLTDQF